MTALSARHHRVLLHDVARGRDCPSAGRRRSRRASSGNLVDRAGVDVAGRGDAALAAASSCCEQETPLSRRTRRTRISRTRRASPLVFDQSPEESLTPATFAGNFFSSRSTSASVIGTCDTGGDVIEVEAFHRKDRQRSTRLNFDGRQAAAVHRDAGRFREPCGEWSCVHTNSGALNRRAPAIRPCRRTQRVL